MNVKERIVDLLIAKCPEDAEELAMLQGGSSPWGPIQSVEPILPGIVMVSTASHGGWWLSEERNRQVPAAWRQTDFVMRQWFEEDCCWALAAITFADELDALPSDYENTLGHWWKRAKPSAERTVARLVPSYAAAKEATNG